MKGVYRDLLKHSSIYGLGQVLSRIASLVMLPIYTRYLHRGDYGCIAILDLTVNILAIMIASGLSAAVTRYHFEAKDESQRDAVWWSGITLISLTATAIVLPIWFVRTPLAHLTLGADLEQGGFYYALALPTLWLATAAELPTTYLRVRKWSGLFLLLSLGRLLLNIALNVLFLVVLHLGVAGILLGNLLATGVQAAILFAIFLYGRGGYRFQLALAGKLLAFGLPLMVAALAALLMHNADRYLIRVFRSVDDVGIYSLAYQVGQGVNTLYTLPFGAIWSVLIYELAQLPQSRELYARVFQYFLFGLMLIMLGVALFAQQILAFLTTPEYLGASSLIPIVCLAYVFFSLHDHFKVPVLLAKRTVSIFPVSVSAAIVNIVSNLLLIPRFGIDGAAWATVLTFAFFSFVGLWRYRKFDQYPYPFAKCAVVLVGMTLTYLICRLVSSSQALWLSVGLAVALWLGWAAVLFGRFGYQFLTSGGSAWQDVVLEPEVVSAGQR